MMRIISFLFIVFSVSATTFCCCQEWKQYADSVKFYNVKKIPDKAYANYWNAKELMSEISVFIDTLSLPLRNLAVQYYNNGQTEQVVAVSRELMSISSKAYSEMNLDFAWGLNMIGVVYNNAGKLDTAKALYLRSKEIRQKLADKSPAYAQSCNNLGSLYRDLGRYDQAEPLLIEAKEIRKTLPPEMQEQYATTCVSLGNLYRDLGQYEKAESYYLQAKDIRGSFDTESRVYASSCNILADLYFYWEQYEKAEALYLEAKKINEKEGKENFEYASSCNNLASLYRDMKQYQKAENLAIEAKSIFEKILEDDDGTITINLNGLGELYYAMGKYKEAEKFFSKARERWKKELGVNHPFFMANTEEMARLYRDMDDIAKADRMYSQVVGLKYKQLNKIFTFTNEREKQLYLKNINGTSDEYQSFCYRKKPRTEAGNLYDISLRYRSLILSSIQQLRQVIHNSGDLSLLKSYDQWTAVKKQLAYFYGKGEEADPESITELENQADSIEKILSRRSSAFETIQKGTTWKDIYSKLKPNEAAIEFIEFHLQASDDQSDSVMYVALLLKKTMKQPLLIPLLEEKQLNQLMQQPGDDANTINGPYLSANLFRLLWMPIEKKLNGISKIYYAPSGNLFRISFGAIPMNDGLLLSDKYKLIQLNTTATVANEVKNYVISPSANILLYGGIDYDADTTALKLTARGYSETNSFRSLPDDLTRGSGFRYLPGTKEEIDEIKKQADEAGIKATMLSGVNASKKSFMSIGESSSPAILHIATHGFFFDDPANDSLADFRKRFETSGKIFRESQNPMFRSGLLFAGGNNGWRGRTASNVDNGIVTAFEISSTLYLANTKLVVLSACETARGHVEGSEGVYGLQRAFKIAGVQNLVMSLWKVPDAETSDFMQTFYKNIFRRQPVNDAFFNAQNAMKAKYSSEPYKWAAWVLVR
ncbi:MAG: CHAT domain-containing protein [Chitinophagales bacterium]